MLILHTVAYDIVFIIINFYIFFTVCTEEFVGENKRLKGIGIGAPEGPISLDDFRSLQRSNTVYSFLDTIVVSVK